MMAVTFDTLKFTRTLRDAGLPEGQAEAMALAFKNAQEESELVSKTDLQSVEVRFTGEIKLLRADFRDVETRLTSEMKLLKWMMGATFGGVVFILLRLLISFPH